MSFQWTKKKVWGYAGYSYFLEVAIGVDRHSFTVDQPRKGFWVARGWKNGDMTMYREARTMASAKNEVVTRIIEIESTTKGVDLEDGRCDLCDRIERFGHWHYCPNNSMARQRGVTRENYSGNPFVPPKEGTDQ